MADNGITDQDLKSPADYQQLVEDIESLMASPVGVEVGSIVRLHARFDQAAKSINSRLRDCDQLLKKGLRNEALDRCETQPRLLDLFLILDFPERESWNATVQQCGLKASDLFVGIAADLNDAIVTEKPLADLKYQVRLHALARSPLPVRIRVMRKLAKLDQNSTVWEDDLKVFEQTRHNQLNHEIRAAIHSGNVAALKSLSDELQNPDWFQPPPRNLQKQIAEALSEQRRSHALHSLQTLEPELVAAFAAFDVIRGRELRKEWEQYAIDAGIPAADPLMQQVAPTLRWLNEQDQQEREQLAYERVLAALNDALDAGAARLVLEEKYHSLMNLGRGIPDDIRQRLEDRLQLLDRERNHALIIRVAGIAAVVCVLLGVAVYAMEQVRFQSHVRAEVAILQKMLEEKQLLEAEAYLAKLDADFPAMARSIEIQQLQSDLKLAKEKDAVRTVEFEGLLTSARKDGLDHSTLQSIPKALNSLSKAWDMAVYSSEKGQVKDLSKAIEERQTSLQQTADTQFEQDVTRRRDQFAGLKLAPLDNLAALQSLRAEIGTLVEREGVSTEVREAQGLPLVADVDQSIQKGLKQQSEARFLNDIHSAIGDRSKFFTQLDRYCSSPDFAGTSRTNDFQRVIKTDAALVGGYLSWIAYLEGLMRRDLTSVDIGMATKLRSEGEKLIKDHPGFPFVAPLQEALTYVSKQAVRERGSPVMEQLLALKAFKLLSGRSEGKRYYLSVEPSSKDGRGAQMVKYFVDTEFKATKQERLMNLEGEPGWRSPQMQFELDAGELLSKLRDQRGANWDQTFLELLAKLFNSPMDPILKIQLIPHILTAAGDGSPFVPRRLEKIATEIERQKLNPSANWVLPDDVEANQVRIRAEALLKRVANDLHDVKPLMIEADQYQQTLKHPRFDVRYVWNAWLHRDHDNKWTCTFRGKSPLNSLSSDLYVLQRLETGEISFVRIGQVQQGQIKIVAAAPDLLEGRPVFETKQDAGP